MNTSMYPTDLRSKVRSLKVITKPQGAPSRAICLYGKARSIRSFLAVYRQRISESGTVFLFPESYDFPFLQAPGSHRLRQLKRAKHWVLCTSREWIELYLELARYFQHVAVICPTIFHGECIGRRDGIRYKAQFDRAVQVLSEDSDKYLYRRLLAARMGSAEDIFYFFLEQVPEKELTERQYLDHVKIGHIEVILDGGLHDTFTVGKFISEMRELKEIYTFDPVACDGANLLRAAALKNGVVFEIQPLALWRRCGTRGFLIDQMDRQASTLDFDPKNGQDGIVEVQTITVDKFFRLRLLKKVDFIKLDIEGAELDALRGSLRTIRRCRPQLAVSIYHKITDLFEIPIFLSDSLRNYQFCLGHYSGSFSDTVLYCIPRELV